MLRWLLCLWVGVLLGAPEALAAPRDRLRAPLRQRLASAAADQEIAVGVVLRGADLPRRGAVRRAQVAARQQAVLDALPAGARARRRYRTLSGFAARLRPAAIAALERHPDVVSVYLDRKVYASLAQGGALVGADVAHGQGLTGSGVKVAVLDSGIDSNHPDLQDDLAAQHCFCDDTPFPFGGCCPGNVSESNSAEDDNGHGTGVSGIVTSAGVSTVGLGVAPDAEIVAVKVLDSSGVGDFSDIAAALDWVLTESQVPGGPVEGVRVVNLSLGDGGQYDDDSVSPCSGTNTAIAIANLHAAGIAVFAASGNEGHDAGVSFPACVPEAIAVGGVYDASVGTVQWCANSGCSAILCTDNATQADDFVCHSNSGALLDLLAPDWRTLSSALGGGATNFGGTSAASPYAAAEAALLFDLDPTLTPEDVRTLLTSHGPLVTNSDNLLSFPRSNVAAAITELQGGVQLVLSAPGADFTAGDATSLSVEVRDGNGNRVVGDDSTAVTFTPSGSARVAAVTLGSGDASYGVAGGAETVTVSGGRVTLELEDPVAETFAVAFANDAGLVDPPDDSIDVAPAAASQLVVTLAASDFQAGGSSALAVEVQDAYGNPIDDDSTAVGFAPTGGGTVASVTTGSGDGSYGVPGGTELVTVSGGQASVVLASLVAGSFDLVFSNDAALANPPSEMVMVSAAAAAQLVMVTAPADFAAGGSTTLALQLQDVYGNRALDDTTQLTFSPDAGGTVSDVMTGSGDGGYGVPGGAETVTVSGGDASIVLSDLVAETFSVGFANDAGLTDPTSESVAVSPGAPAQLVLVQPGVDFAAGRSTDLVLEVRDAHGNFTPDESSASVTFAPTGSASISNVLDGAGDGIYGVPGGPESVTVADGLAAVAVTDTLAETFTVAFSNDAGLLNPADDSITVTAGASGSGGGAVTAVPVPALDGLGRALLTGALLAGAWLATRRRD